MKSISQAEVQANLPAILQQLQAPESLIITDGNHPVALLVSLPADFKRTEQESGSGYFAGTLDNRVNPVPRLGSCRGMLTILAEDDEHLQDFADYMP